MPKGPPDAFDATVESRERVSGMADTLDTAGRVPTVVSGRYRLISELGRGGMGVVWRARDLELERDVAIKLLRRDAAGDTGSAGESRTRLLREARALAQLSHPNIVPVFDVGTTDDGEVWVAMEYVVGTAGNRWHARKWRRVLEIYRQVGAGLAAAHAAGIVHRDFKPANFMIGDDGRVRVLDFGLARKQKTETELVAIREAGDETDLSRSMTQEGTLLGTPAYMSPEQMHGDVADTPSDQFSFAVSLWESLYKQHPFPATNFAQLGVRITEGDIEPPPPHEVPANIETALRRALEVDADDRFSSMEELVSALAPPTRRKWPLAVGLAAATLAGATATVVLTRGSGPEACPVDDAGWTQAVGDEVASALRERFPKRAPDFIDRLETSRRDWILARQRVCLASHRGYQTDEILATRMACLDELRLKSADLPGVVARLGPDGLARAGEAFDSMRTAEECVNATGLPVETALSEGEESARDGIVSAELRYELGLHGEAFELVDPIVSALKVGPAEKIGSAGESVAQAPVQSASKVLLARALRTRGNANIDNRRYEDAEKDFKEALDLFSELGDQQKEARVWIALTLVVSNQGRTEEARGLATAAKAAITRANLPDESARLEMVLANLAQREGRFDDARKQLEAARDALAAAAETDSPELGNIDTHLGQLALYRGKPDEAVLLYERGATAHTRASGPEHPATLRARSGLATALSVLGEAEKAAAIHRSIFALQRESLGADDPQTLDTQFKLAGALRAMFRRAEAYELMLDGLKRRQKGADKRAIATSLTNVASLESDLGKNESAITRMRTALTLQEELGDKELGIVATLLNLTRALRRSGDCESAAPVRERAYKVLAKTLGKAHEFTAVTVSEAAECALAASDYKRAARLFEEAIGPLSGKPHTLETHAAAELGLAIALSKIAARKGEARTHAELALKLFKGQPFPDLDQVARAEAFLKKQPSGSKKQP